MEQNPFIEEKNIFKKIFLYSKERNKLIDLENNVDMAFKVFNEKELYKDQEINNGKSPNERNNKHNEIKKTYNIKFNFIDEISCRGLDNVELLAV